MKKIILLLFVFFVVIKISGAQTPLQITGNDCNGNSHDLFADLDAGKAVVVFFFMDACGSCPPPAQKIQAMANNVMTTYPGMVTGYVMPYINTTTCTATSNWVNNNSVPFYAPYDSGAYQVAYYGGFGMPSVVLLGGSGANRRVMFSTLSFATSDTTIIRDSILALLNTTGISDVQNSVFVFSVFPNPASDNIFVSISMKESSNLFIDVADISGKQVAIIFNEKQSGLLTRRFNVSGLSDGNYFVRLHANEKSVTQKITVTH